MSIALINGKIHTLDDKNSITEALAIDGNVIAQIGSNQEIQESGKTYAQTLDLEGCTVLPGFIDSHTHLGQIALESLWVDLTETESTDEILVLLKDRINKTPTGDWVVGVMYDDSGWRAQECLTKDVLDELSSNHPIFLRRVCGHYGIANSLALEQIPDNWQYIDRSTGTLIEDVVLGFMKIVKPDFSKRLEGTRNIMAKLHSMGITGVREIVNSQSIKAYKLLDSENSLVVRIFGYVILDDLDEYLKEHPDGKYKGENFNIIGVKLFLDGSFGARTAALKEPYSDDPGNYGKLLHTNSELRSILQRIYTLDLALMVHAIGDQAVQQFVDIYQEIFKDQIPYNPQGHSLEHVELIDEKLVGIIKELGIWVSAQPNFAGRWSLPGGLNVQRLGQERLSRCNAYKTILENKIPLVFGSDSMPLGPLFGLRSAIFHPVGKQRISSFDAVKAYTQSCHSLLAQETKFGSLSQGKQADMIILSGDPFSASETEFGEISVIGTIFNGDLVYPKTPKLILSSGMDC